jgi:hypothetical protein
MARRVLLAVSVALAAALGALAVVVSSWDGDSPESDDPPAQVDPISATGTLTPRTTLFGDTLTARVDVVVDRTIIDADEVSVTWSSGAWKPVAEPVTSRRDSAGTAHLRTTYVLRCLTRPCVPVRETEQVDFDPARVTYEAPVGGTTRRLSVDVPWPTLVVHSRVAETDDSRDALSSPWRADLSALPLVSYSASPGVVLALLFAAGTGLFVLAGVLVFRAIPERQPPPEPEPEPVPVATLLEQALALLEAPAAANGAPERRRALELVADEVESWGDRAFAQAARTLAWSEHEPEGDTTKAFAAQLRSRMEA